jgi:hypothetical protein
MPPSARVSGLHAAVSKLPPRITSSFPPPGSAGAADVEAACLAVLGSVDVVPKVVAGADPGKRKLDHRAGFVLTFVDGASSIDAILDASGLPRLELLSILRDLVEAGVLKT